MEKAQGLLEEACASLRDPYKPASEQLLRKALRQRLLEDEVLAHHLRRLKLHLRPLDEPQGRVYPFVIYALKHSEALARLQALPALGEERLDLG